MRILKGLLSIILVPFMVLIAIGAIVKLIGGYFRPNWKYALVTPLRLMGQALCVIGFLPWLVIGLLGTLVYDACDRNVEHWTVQPFNWFINFANWMVNIAFKKDNKYEGMTEWLI